VHILRGAQGVTAGDVVSTPFVFGTLPWISNNRPLREETGARQ